MSNPLSPKINAQVAPIQERWTGFMQKVTARIEEIMAEANAGLDELIQQHPLEQSAWGAAWGTLSSRVSALDSKISDAREKLDGELDAVRDGDDVPDADAATMIALGRHWLAQERHLRSQFTRRYAMFETRKWADRSRALYPLAKAEAARPYPCTSCGGPLAVTVYWAASNVACPHCRVQNSVAPGPAGGLYFSSMHHLAQESALAEWNAEQDIRARYGSFRCPTSTDFDHALAATRAFYTKYHTYLKSMDPSFVGTIEDATAAKLKHHTAYDQPRDALAREFRTKLLDAVKRRDQGATTELLRNLPAAVDLEECSNCVYERGGDRAGAEFVIGLEYKITGEEDPFKPWLADRMDSLVRHIDVVN